MLFGAIKKIWFFGPFVFTGLLLLQEPALSAATQGTNQQVTQLLSGLGSGNSSGLGRSYFGQCGLGAAGAAVSSASSLGTLTGTYPLDAAGCPQVDVGTDDTNPSCEDFTVGGTVNSADILAELNKAQDGVIATQCRKGKLEEVRAQINCVKQGMSALSQQITSLNPQISQALQAYQNFHLQSKNEIDNDQALIEDVQKQLRGDPATGRVGLMAAKATLDGLNASISAEIVDIRSKYNILSNQRRSFATQVETIKMGATNQCFNSQTDPRYRCVPNGPPVSAREYLLCRFEQQSRTQGGQMDNRASTGQRAVGNRVGLESLLAAMQNDIPQNTEVAIDEAGVTRARRDAALPIQRMSDVERVYGNRLSQYNAPGVNAHDFVLGALRACNQRANAQVARQQGQADSTIALAEMNLRYGPNRNEGEEGVKLQTNQLLTKYRNGYAEAWNALSGEHAPPNDQACRQTTDSRRKIACLEEYKQRIDSLYNGHGEGAGRVVQLRGRPAPGVTGGKAIAGTANVVCRGLADCVTQMQAKATSLATHKAATEQTRTTVIAQLTGNYRTAITGVANQLKAQNDGIRAQVDSLNQMMSSLGIEGALAPESVDPEQIELDENGLPRAPQNLMNVVGGQMSPPMFKLDGSGMSEGENSITARGRELTEESGKLSTRMNRLRALQGSCAATRERDVVAGILEPLGSGNECLATACTGANSNSALGALLSSAGSLNLTTTEGTELTSALSQGWTCREREGTGTSDMPSCSAVTNAFNRAQRISDANDDAGTAGGATDE